MNNAGPRVAFTCLATQCELFLSHPKSLHNQSGSPHLENERPAGVEAAVLYIFLILFIGNKGRKRMFYTHFSVTDFTRQTILLKTLGHNHFSSFIYRFPFLG